MFSRKNTQQPDSDSVATFKICIETCMLSCMGKITSLGILNVYAKFENYQNVLKQFGIFKNQDGQ